MGIATPWGYPDQTGGEFDWQTYGPWVVLAGLFVLAVITNDSDRAHRRGGKQ